MGLPVKTEERQIGNQEAAQGRLKNNRERGYLRRRTFGATQQKKQDLRMASIVAGVQKVIIWQITESQPVR